MADDGKPKQAGGSGLRFITVDTYERIRKLLEAAHLMPDPAQFEVFERAGKKQFRYRGAAEPAAPGGSGSGGAAVDYQPWKPNFFTTGTDPSIVYKCTFNLGTVNQVIAENLVRDHLNVRGDDHLRAVFPNRAEHDLE